MKMDPSLSREQFSRLKANLNWTIVYYLNRTAHTFSLSLTFWLPATHKYVWMYLSNKGVSSISFNRLRCGCRCAQVERYDAEIRPCIMRLRSVYGSYTNRIVRSGWVIIFLPSPSHSPTPLPSACNWPTFSSGHPTSIATRTVSTKMLSLLIP